MSRRDIPGWVIGAIGLWGRQKRRVWIGADWHGNIDGYSQSLLGRIRDEREGAGEQGARSQHWPEVFWGQGLDVQRGIVGMREVPYSVMHLHYVWPPEWELTIGTKAKLVGISRADYWRELENAETWAHAKLDSTSDCAPKEKLLHVVTESTTTSPLSANVTKLSMRELDLAALNRPKISLRR